MKLIIALFCFLFCACYRGEKEGLTLIQVQDRNGLTETISSPEKLASYETTDFLASQPYKKVTRVFKKEGGNQSILTTYHPNGMPWQYLEAEEMRAKGAYREWFSNGQLKIDAVVIGGTADLFPGAQEDWLFEGENKVFSEKGHPVATFQYQGGKLEGESLYFYPNGTIQAQVVNQNGVLQKGTYYDEKGEVLSMIENGCGFQVSLEGGFQIWKEFQKGIAQGVVKKCTAEGQVIKNYKIQNGKKEGEEWEYFDGKKPKMKLDWHENKIHGLVKTWYENGQLQSERNFVRNQKQGAALSWYKDGSLMLFEEYEEGRLMKGQYYKIKNKEPVSTVLNGNGIVTLFDENGAFLSKMIYQKGKPVEE